MADILYPFSLNGGSTGWRRSDRFKWLDPSEKRFLSYMLGSAQAQLMCNKVLGYGHLAHLDLLDQIGLLRKPPSPRPDFVAFNLSRNTAVAFVEAKGKITLDGHYSHNKLEKR